MNPASSRSILYGICGIGLGHVHRQLPVIETLLERSYRIMFFAYGESFTFLSNRFDGHPLVRVVQVAVPFWVGGALGLDFAASRLRPENQIDFFSVNANAFSSAETFIGRPDLVISDYEPNAAQYAYAFGSPLVTLDQQSKFLIREDWPSLEGTNCKDEVMRLRMFFPKAEERIACSFFNLTSQSPQSEQVVIVSPTLRNEIRHAPALSEKKSILVYLSAQQITTHDVHEIVSILNAQKYKAFTLCIPREVMLSPLRAESNVTLLSHGDTRFLDVLKNAQAVISTAGHSLLSEAMHLKTPCLLMPLPIYEQQMNAEIISGNGFGMKVASLSAESLREFLDRLPSFQANLRSDSSVLTRDEGLDPIFSILDTFLV